MKKGNKTENGLNWIKLFLFIIFFGAIFFVLRFYGFSAYLSPVFLKEKISSFGIFAPLIFMLIYVVATLLFIPESPFTIFAGAVFGPWLASFYVVIAATVGAFLAFLISRYFLRGLFYDFLLKNNLKKIIKYEKDLKKSGFLTVIFLRLIPLFPFNGLNFTLGITSVKAKDYFWGTFLGIIPGAFAFAYFGDSLAKVSFWNILTSIFLIILLSNGMFFYQKFKKKKQNEFDLIVIGAGSGGLNIASFMNKAGFKVLLISRKEEEIGGDCLNFGCVPSKSFINSAKKFAQAKESEKYGYKLSGKFNWETLKREIQTAQDKIRRHENSKYFEKQGMTVKLGDAKFEGINKVKVGKEVFTGKKIILATGSRPRKFSVPGDDQITIETNETIFNLKKIPKKLLMIGAGPIGLELGNAFLNLGVAVTVVGRDEQILPREDPKIAKKLQEYLASRGMEFYLGFEVEKFKSQTEVVLMGLDKKKKTVEFDTVFASIGRELNIEGLDLEKAQIELTEDGRKIKVNDRLETTNKKVLLCGDVAGGYQFTHGAELHTSVIINNFFSPFKKSVSYDNFSWVTFTDPELATFGLSQLELQKRGVDYEVIHSDFSDDDRAIIENYPVSMTRLFVAPGGKILGGSVLAPGAGELIQELILVMEEELDLGDLLGKIYAYPVATRINRQLAGKFESRKLEKRFNRRLLRLFY